MLAPQISTYEFPPDLVGDRSPWSLYAYTRLSADLGGVIVESQIGDLLDGDWHHVIFEWRSIDGYVAWYFDGVLARNQTGVQKGYALPVGGTLTLGKPRFTAQRLFNLDEVGIFSSILSASDRAILRGVYTGEEASSGSSGGGMMSPSVVGVGTGPSMYTPATQLRDLTGLLTRPNAAAELFYSFDQPIRRDASAAVGKEEERIRDETHWNNDARIVCSTHCAASALMPSRVADAAGGSSVVHLTNHSTILFPVRPFAQDFLILAAYGPYPSRPARDGRSVAPTTEVRLLSLPDSLVANLYRVNASVPNLNAAKMELFYSSAGDPEGTPNYDSPVSAASVPLQEGDVIRLDEMSPDLIEEGLIAFVMRLEPSLRYFDSFTLDFIPVSPENTSARRRVGSEIFFGPNHAPNPAPPPGYSSPSASTSYASAAGQASFTRVIEVDELGLTSFLPLFRQYPSADYFAADLDGDRPLQAWIVRAPLNGEGQLYQTEDDARAQMNPIVNASFANPVLVQGGSLTFRAPAFRGLTVTPNMSLLLSDGREQAIQVGVVQFKVLPMPHLPLIASQFDVPVAQDEWILLHLPIDATPLDLQKDDRPYVSFGDLPTAGTLFQFVAPSFAEGQVDSGNSSYDALEQPELVGALRRRC